MGGHTFLDELRYGEAVSFYQRSKATLKMAHMGILAAFTVMAIYNLSVHLHVQCNELAYERLHKRGVSDTCAALSAQNATQHGVVKMFDGTEWVAEWEAAQWIPNSRETHFGMPRQLHTFRATLLVSLPLVITFSLQFVWRYVTTTHSFVGFGRKMGQGDAGFSDFVRYWTKRLGHHPAAFRYLLYTELVFSAFTMLALLVVMAVSYVMLVSDYHTVDECSCLRDTTLELMSTVFFIVGGLLYAGGLVIAFRRNTPTFRTEYLTMSIAEISSVHTRAAPDASPYAPLAAGAV